MYARTEPFNNTLINIVHQKGVVRAADGKESVPNCSPSQRLMGKKCAKLRLLQKDKKPRFGTLLTNGMSCLPFDMFSLSYDMYFSASDMYSSFSYI